MLFFILSRHSSTTYKLKINREMLRQRRVIPVMHKATRLPRFTLILDEDRKVTPGESEMAFSERGFAWR